MIIYWPYSLGGKACFYFILPYFILILTHITQHAGSLFPDQKSNLSSLQWKHRFLTTGPLRKSPDKISSFRFCDFFFVFFLNFITYVHCWICTNQKILNKTIQQFNSPQLEKTHCCMKCPWDSPPWRVYVYSKRMYDICSF